MTDEPLIVYAAVRTDKLDGEWVDVGTISYSIEATKAMLKKKMGEEGSAYREGNPLVRVGAFQLRED